MSDKPVSMAERELFLFIDSAADVFGPDQSEFLTEIWLDALASLDCMPKPTSPDWHLVTHAGWARLAIRLLEVSHLDALT